MPEALTATIDPMATSTSWAPWGGFRAEEVSTVRPRAPLEDLKLRQALQAFDAARSWEESRAASARALALGPEVVPSVLAELSEPQPPERDDLLIALLLQWTSPDQLIALGLSVDASAHLRAAIAEALGHRARDAQGPPEVRQRIAAMLAQLARDDDPGVRVTAVEAIGLAGLGTPEIEGLLREIAATDGNEAVRNEAKAVLKETSK